MCVCNGRMYVIEQSETICSLKLLEASANLGLIWNTHNKICLLL